MVQKLILILSISMTSSCISTQSTLQTAPTVPKNKVRVTGGESIPVSTRFVAEFTDAAQIAVDRARNSNVDPLTENEEQELIESAIATALLQPTAVTILEGRYGVHDKIDIGLRWSGPAIRFDTKVWLYHKAGGLDVSFGLGATHHTGIGVSVAGKVYEIFDFVKLVDYKRNDADATLYFSGDSKKRFGLYGAFRYTISKIDFQSRLSDVSTDFFSENQSVSEIAHQVGGTGGLRVKIGPMSFMAEMTLSRMFFDPMLGATKRRLSGFVIEPAVGANFNF